MAKCPPKVEPHQEPLTQAPPAPPEKARTEVASDEEVTAEAVAGFIVT